MAAAVKDDVWEGSVFNWLRKKAAPNSDSDVLATAPPGKIFPWPKGAVITAVDEIVLAIPIALFEKDRPMAEAVFGPDDMEVNIPPDNDTFFVRLKPGMSLSLSKSVQSYIVGDDENLRRLIVRMPATLSGQAESHNKTEK